MQALLYANLTNRTLSESSGGAPFSWPDLIEGDTVRVALRFLKTLGDGEIEIDPPVRRVRASLGRLDARPADGQWAIRIGNDPPEEGVNTTAPLAHDASADDLRSALQALLSSPAFSIEGVTADGVEVEARDGSWLLRFLEGSAPYPDEIELRAGRNSLEPISFLRSRSHLVDGRRVHELRLVQSPAAFTDTSARVAPPAPEIDTMQDGGSEGEIVWNEIQSLRVPPQFRGTYRLRRPGSFARSRLLSLADGTEEIAEALEPLADEDGVLSVSNPLPFLAHIEFGGSMGGINHEPLEVEVVGAPPGDVTFELSLATAELANLLRAAPVVENLPFEIEVAIDSPENPEEFLVWTYRAEVTVRRELIPEDLAAAQNIDWLRPPLPKDYVPFTPDQVITGSQHHVSALGDGSNTVFVIDHNLATEALHLTLRENSAGGSLLRPGIDYETVVAGPDSLQVALLGSFAASPPAPAALAATVTSAGPVSAFLAHTHTIAQILGLQTVLDAFGAEIALLKALAPAGALAARERDLGLLSTWTLPPIFEIFPSRRRIEPVGGGLSDLAAAAEASLPRAGGLLAAVHDAEPEALPAPLPEPAPEHFGRVFENQGAELVDLPGGLGRRGAVLEPGGFAACDGRVWYRVEQFGDAPETSYYPADFTRELFRIFVNDRQLRLRTELSLQFAVEAAVLKSNTNCQWSVVVELGSAPQDVDPAVTGLNLQNVVWSPAPVLEQRLILTPVPCVHAFGIRVRRRLVAGVETISLDRFLYGSSEGGTPPESADFAVRGRLVRFDTENREGDPRGFVALRGLDLREEGRDYPPELGRAVIRR